MARYVRYDEAFVPDAVFRAQIHNNAILITAEYNFLILFHNTKIENGNFWANLVNTI